MSKNSPSNRLLKQSAAGGLNFYRVNSIQDHVIPRHSSKEQVSRRNNNVNQMLLKVKKNNDDQINYTSIDSSM